MNYRTPDFTKIKPGYAKLPPSLPPPAIKPRYTRTALQNTKLHLQ